MSKLTTPNEVLSKVFGSPNYTKAFEGNVAQYAHERKLKFESGTMGLNGMHNLMTKLGYELVEEPKYRKKS